MRVGGWDKSQQALDLARSWRLRIYFSRNLQLPDQEGSRKRLEKKTEILPPQGGCDLKVWGNLKGQGWPLGGKSSSTHRKFTCRSKKKQKRTERTCYVASWVVASGPGGSGRAREGRRGKKPAVFRGFCSAEQKKASAEAKKT